MTRDEIFEMLKPWGWSAQTVDLGIGADFRCEYCYRDLIASVDDYDAWQIDHILPRTDEREALWNLALSCKTCNFLKRHSIPTTPIDPSKDRASAIAVVRELINERRARKQKQVDFLKQKFRCAEWPSMRMVIVAISKPLQPTPPGGVAELDVRRPL
ncbi:MAG: hypothetical protein NTAFB01_24320 [Nitrospira sp.]